MSASEKSVVFVISGRRALSASMTHDGWNNA